MQILGARKLALIQRSAVTNDARYLQALLCGQAHELHSAAHAAGVPDDSDYCHGVFLQLKVDFDSRSHTQLAFHQDTHATLAEVKADITRGADAAR
jgi:hypothetical protein